MNNDLNILATRKGLRVNVGLELFIEDIVLNEEVRLHKLRLGFLEGDIIYLRIGTEPLELREQLVECTPPVRGILKLVLDLALTLVMDGAHLLLEA